MIRDLEGSLNERAVVMLLSYTIGFITAFILFAAPASPLQPPSSEWCSGSDCSQQHSLRSAQTSSPSMAVLYKEQALVVQDGDHEVVLSINADSLSQNTAAVLGSLQGVHTAIAGQLISPDARFVFFCEVRNDPDTCLPFIYDTASNLIHFVRVDNVPFPIASKAAANATWYPTGKLSLGNYRSSTPTQPWIVETP